MNTSDLRSTRVGDKRQTSSSKIAWFVGLSAFAVFGCLFGSPGVGNSLVLEVLCRDQVRVPLPEITRIARDLLIIWYVLPAAGILIDRCKAFRQRRRECLTGAASAAVVVLIALQLCRLSTGMLLSLGLLLTGSMVVGSAIAGGILFDKAAAEYSAGGLSAALSLARNGITIALLAAGAHWFRFFLISRYISSVGVVCFLLFIFLMVMTWGDPLWGDGGAPQVPMQSPLRGCSVYWLALAAWILLAPFSLSSLSPDDTALGYMWENAIVVSAAVFAALIYLAIWRRTSLRHLLFLGIGASVLEAILEYHLRGAAPLAFAASGWFLCAWAGLALFDLLVRSSPQGLGGFSYGLIIIGWGIGDSLLRHVSIALHQLQILGVFSRMMAIHLAAAAVAAIIVWALPLVTADQ